MESFLLKGNLCLDRYVKVVAPITGPRNGCSNTYQAPVTFQMDASNAWGNIGYLFRNQFDSMCLERYSTSSGYLLYPHNLLPNLLVLLCLKNSRQMSSSSGMMSGKAWGCLKHCPMSYGTPSQQPLRRWLRVGMHDLMMRLPSYRFGSVLYGGYRMTLDVLTSLRNGFLSNGCSETFRTLRRPGRILMPSWKQREKLTKLSPAPQSMRCWPNVTKSSARSHRGWNALNLMLAHRECHVLPPSPRTSGTKRTSWVKSCTLRYFNLKRPHMFQFWLDRRGKESSSWCTCLQDGGGLETSTGGWIRLLINGFPATTSGLPPTIRPLTPFWGIWREQLWAAGEPRRMWGDIGPVLAARPAKPSARRGTLSLQLSWKPVGPGPFAVRPPFWGIPDRSIRELEQLRMGNRFYINCNVLEFNIALRGGMTLLEHPADPQEDGKSSSWQSQLHQHYSRHVVSSGPIRCPYGEADGDSSDGHPGGEVRDAPSLPWKKFPAKGVLKNKEVLI